MIHIPCVGACWRGELPRSQFSVFQEYPNFSPHRWPDCWASRQVKLRWKKTVDILRLRGLHPCVLAKSVQLSIDSAASWLQEAKCPAELLHCLTHLHSICRSETSEPPAKSFRLVWPAQRAAKRLPTQTQDNVLGI